MAANRATSRLHAVLFRHWWLAFLLMGVSFVLFGLLTLDLLRTLGANLTFLSTYGVDAVRDGGLLQLLQMVVYGYLAAASYVVFKLCETILVERLMLGRKGGDS